MNRRSNATFQLVGLLICLCNVIINILTIYYYLHELGLRIIRGYVPPADIVFPLPFLSCLRRIKEDSILIKLSLLCFNITIDTSCRLSILIYLVIYKILHCFDPFGNGNNIQYKNKIIKYIQLNEIAKFNYVYFVFYLVLIYH